MNRLDITEAISMVPKEFRSSNIFLVVLFDESLFMVASFMLRPEGDTGLTFPYDIEKCHHTYASTKKSTSSLHEGSKCIFNACSALRISYKYCLIYFSQKPFWNGLNFYKYFIFFNFFKSIKIPLMLSFSYFKGLGLSVNWELRIEPRSVRL